MNKLTLLLVTALLAACETILPAPTAPPRFYALDPTQTELGSVPPMPNAPTLVVNPPHAASGFDSQRIIYIREAHLREYYVQSEWVDTPARMLAPLLANAAHRSGAFRAVVLTPSAASGDLRLDTEIVRLQHDLSTQPSQVRFTLRAYLIDNSNRQVIAWREFDETAKTASENPQGSVAAANQAVQNAMDALTIYLRNLKKISG